MKTLSLFLSGLALFSATEPKGRSRFLQGVRAQDAIQSELPDAGIASHLSSEQAGDGAVIHKYESDISRLRHLVIHSLYSHKDVFLRELLSNANDALEKMRLAALGSSGTAEDASSIIVPDGWQGNVTIEIVQDDQGLGQLIIRDTGIGMSKADLTRNLGTIAKSGTAEFLRKASQQGPGADGSSLIGQFGLGFYSSFLVSPSVKVASLPPATTADREPHQYVFESSADGDQFTVFPDQRGESLAREGGPCGTEVILQITDKDNAWVLNEDQIKNLVARHSQFSTTFPIYIRKRDLDSEFAPEWVQLNEQGPIWMRDPKQLSEEDYKAFYQTLDTNPGAEALAWNHWRGDSGSGVSFRAMIYVPTKVPEDFWQTAVKGVKNVKLMVKRVFITDDLGDGFLPPWLSFIKVIVDADDLPLNVSRETLQKTRFLRQLQRILIRKALDLFAKLAKDNSEEYQQFSKVYGHALKVGLLDSEKKDQDKLAELLRFSSTRSNFTSLEEYVTNRKTGQDQIFFLGGVGESVESLSKSPFLEVPVSRGYEVLLLNGPADESAMATMKSYKGMQFQDVSKKGLRFGDEDEDDGEKEEFEEQKKIFEPLVTFLKNALAGKVSDVVLTTRLVKSPCAVVSETYGWSANLQKIMAAQARSEDDALVRMMLNQPKILEINPQAPLIEGMLDRVLEVFGGDETDEEVQNSEGAWALTETAKVLYETSLVKSGFGIEDKNGFFDRVESLLRRNIGVSLAARGERQIRPAPPTATGPLPKAAEESTGNGPEGATFMDWQDLKKMMDSTGTGVDEENAEEESETPSHDEL